MVCFLLLWEWGDTDSLVLGMQVDVYQSKITDQNGALVEL
jgi:hypothetical protein